MRGRIGKGQQQEVTLEGATDDRKHLTFNSRIQQERPPADTMGYRHKSPASRGPAGVSINSLIIAPCCENNIPLAGQDLYTCAIAYAAMAH